MSTVCSLPIFRQGFFFVFKFYFLGLILCRLFSISNFHFMQTISIRIFSTNKFLCINSRKQVFSYFPIGTKTVLMTHGLLWYHQFSMQKKTPAILITKGLQALCFHGATGGIRTPDPRLRRPLLYPTELLSQIKMVGAAGFEPATPWSQARCSTKLSHAPIVPSLNASTQHIIY